MTTFPSLAVLLLFIRSVVPQDAKNQTEKVERFVVAREGSNQTEKIESSDTPDCYHGHWDASCCGQVPDFHLLSSLHATANSFGIMCMGPPERCASNWHYEGWHANGNSWTQMLGRGRDIDDEMFSVGPDAGYGIKSIGLCWGCWNYDCKDYINISGREIHDCARSRGIENISYDTENGAQWMKQNNPGDVVFIQMSVKIVYCHDWDSDCKCRNMYMRVS